MTDPKQPATLIDLFSGCGGLTKGFLDADDHIRPLLAVEMEAPEAASYAANFVTATVFNGQIERLDASSLAEADIVVGGPPCQGFSGLGKRDPEDHRNRLWRAYVDVVLAANPKVFVIENVARFFASPEFAELTEDLRVGRLRHYRFVSGVLNAADFGVPQRRRRAFVIASRVGSPRMPEPTHDRYGRHGLPKWRTVRDAIADLPLVPATNDLPDRKTDFGEASLPGAFMTSELHIGRTYRPESLKRYAHIAPGRGRLDLPVELQYRCWREKPSGTTDVLGRLVWDAPAVTIRTEFHKPEKGRYLHPEWSEDGRDTVNRALTHREAARIQSFPDDFKWCGSKLQIGRQIGNAVPPLLAREIARQSVLPLLAGDEKVPAPSAQLVLLPEEEQADEVAAAWAAERAAVAGQ